MAKKGNSNLVLVKWVGNNSKTFDGVQQRINKKYVVEENPHFLQEISVKWNHRIWKAVYMERQPLQKKFKTKTDRKTKVSLNVISSIVACINEYI